MRILLIGCLLALLGYALSRLAPRMKHTPYGTILARMGWMLSLLSPRLRHMMFFLSAMLPYLWQRTASAKAGQGHGASSMTPAQARELLGVAADAGREEITAAWRRQMLHHHPDHGGTGEAVSRLNEARDLLLKGLK